MTQEQLEQCLNLNLPSLKIRLIKDDKDCDILQEVLLWLTEHVSDITYVSDKALVQLVKAHFFRRVSLMHWHTRRALKYYDFIGDHFTRATGITQKIGVYEPNPEPRLYNPWSTLTTEALEYIDMITDPRAHRWMVKYYVEGYTLAEIAHQENVSVAAISKQLDRSVNKIKELLAETN